MTSKIITGNRTAEDIIRDYFAKLSNAKTKNKKTDSIKKSGEKNTVTFPPVITTTKQSLSDFYAISKTVLLKLTTKDYRTFLRESGYADIDTCSNLYIAKGLLKIDKHVRDTAKILRLEQKGSDADYVTNIDQIDARNLVHHLSPLIPEYRLLTVGLMYKVFIPYIQELVIGGDAEAKETLDEMTYIKAEWLEDLVLDRGSRGKKVQIAHKARNISLSRTDRYFKLDDLNNFGYPVVKNGIGSYRYVAPTESENAVFRDTSPSLILVLGRGPSFANGLLGVRVAKFL